MNICFLSKITGNPDMCDYSVTSWNTPHGIIHSWRLQTPGIQYISTSPGAEIWSILRLCKFRMISHFLLNKCGGLYEYITSLIPISSRWLLPYSSYRLHISSDACLGELDSSQAGDITPTRDYRRLATEPSVEKLLGGDMLPNIGCMYRILTNIHRITYKQDIRTQWLFPCYFVLHT